VVAPCTRIATQIHEHERGIPWAEQGFGQQEAALPLLVVIRGFVNVMNPWSWLGFLQAICVL
jgi:hypothetical protein